MDGFFPYPILGLVLHKTGDAGCIPSNLQWARVASVENVLIVSVRCGTVARQLIFSISFQFQQDGLVSFVRF